MLDSHSSLARSYISDAIKNSTAAIKACWTIVFTAGTVGALSTLNELMRCRHFFLGFYSLEFGRTLNCKYDQWSVNYVLAFFVYFLTFVRFYLGSIRTFDIKYFEMFSLINSEIALEKSKSSLERFSDLLSYNDGRWLKAEVFVLLFQSIVVVFLAYNLDAPIVFVNIYCFLLITNSIWLFASALRRPKTITQLEARVFPKWSVELGLHNQNLPRHAMLKWGTNNLLHFLLIAFILLYSQNYLTNFAKLLSISQAGLSFALLSICMSNCILDFVVSYNFYFPKFLPKYRLVCPADKIN